MRAASAAAVASEREVAVGDGAEGDAGTSEVGCDCATSCGFLSELEACVAGDTGSDVVGETDLVLPTILGGACDRSESVGCVSPLRIRRMLALV